MSRPLALTSEKRAIKEKLKVEEKRIKKTEIRRRIQINISKSKIVLSDEVVNEAYRLCTDAKEDMWKILRLARYAEYDIQEAKRRNDDVGALEAYQKNLQKQCDALEAKRLADLAAIGLTNITGL